MINVLFMGTPDIAIGPLKAVMDNKELNLVGLVSQPDKPVGRKRELKPTPTKQYLIDNNIDVKVFQPEKIIEVKDELEQLNIDVIITCAYGQFLPTKILEIPSKWALNLHASILPKYRGGAPIHYAVMNGEKETGVSVMEMVKKMDAGQVFKVYKVNIGDDENTSQVYEKLKTAAYDAVACIPDIVAGKITGIEQDESKVTFSPNISKEERKISIDNDVEIVHNHIRGLSEVPCGHFIYDDKLLKVYKATIIDRNKVGKPGEILSFDGGFINVQAKKGVIGFEIVQIEGKSRMNSKDAINGNLVKIGEFIN